MRQSRRGREYLDFYEWSEIKSLVTRDQLKEDVTEFQVLK